jgi:hypothetical protein
MNLSFFFFFFVTPHMSFHHAISIPSHMNLLAFNMIYERFPWWLFEVVVPHTSRTPSPLHPHVNKSNAPKFFILHYDMWVILLWKV